MAKTPRPSIFLMSGPTAAIETAEMTMRLKAAEPTMVEGPSLPGAWPKVVAVSMRERRI